MDQKSLINERWHKANLIGWYLQMAPFIRFVAITGSMAYDAVKPSSDIDIFIIAKNHRIWTCRAYCLTLLRFVGQLRTGNLPHQRAGKICPNRFVTDSYLMINPQNQYHAQDYTQMVPLVDLGNYYHKFITANSWMEKFGYFKPRKTLNLVESHSLNGVRRALERILKGSYGNKVEANFRKKQLAQVKREEPTLNESGSSIIANDNEIRIHPHERS